MFQSRPLHHIVCNEKLAFDLLCPSLFLLEVTQCNAARLTPFTFIYKCMCCDTVSANVICDLLKATESHRHMLTRWV